MIKEVRTCDRCGNKIEKSGTHGVSDGEKIFSLGVVIGDLCFTCLEQIIYKASRTIVHVAGS